MKERAEQAGGTLTIVSSPEQGTDIELIVPVL
jgi:signal transduction histidine kinase